MEHEFPGMVENVVQLQSQTYSSSFPFHPMADCRELASRQDKTIIQRVRLALEQSHHELRGSNNWLILRIMIPQSKLVDGSMLANILLHWRGRLTALLRTNRIIGRRAQVGVHLQRREASWCDVDTNPIPRKMPSQSNASSSSSKIPKYGETAVDLI